MSDLISRAEAIEAVMAEGRKVYTSECANAERIIYEADAVEALSMLPSAEAVQGDAISKRFISDAILQKISELNAQGEKAIPIAREFIRFKRFVDGLTPIRTDAGQGEWTDIDDYYRMATCSRCHKVTMFEKWGEYTKPYDFCPNCGARMKGGAE